MAWFQRVQPHNHSSSDQGGVIASPWIVQLVPWMGQPASSVGTWISSLNANCLGNGVYVNNSHAINDSVVWNVVLANGTWAIDVLYTAGSNGGQGTLAIDDGAGNFTTIGSVEAYAAATAYNQLYSHALTIAGDSKIKRQLSLTIAAKNASSTSYYFNLQSIQFRRTA